MMHGAPRTPSRSIHSHTLDRPVLWVPFGSHGSVGRGDIYTKLGEPECEKADMLLDL
jgi:hypothetical protein